MGAAKRLKTVIIHLNCSPFKFERQMPVESMLSSKDQMSREDYVALVRGRMVSTAKAILDGERGVIDGSRELWRLRLELDDEADPDFAIFVAVDSETDHLPVDRERENWSMEALKRKVVEIAGAEDLYRASVMKACRKVIQRFDSGSGI